MVVVVVVVEVAVVVVVVISGSLRSKPEAEAKAEVEAWLKHRLVYCLCLGWGVEGGRGGVIGSSAQDVFCYLFGEWLGESFWIQALEIWGLRGLGGLGL